MTATRSLPVETAHSVAPLEGARWDLLVVGGGTAGIGAEHAGPQSGPTVRTMQHAEVDRAIAEGHVAGFSRLILDREAGRGTPRTGHRRRGRTPSWAAAKG